LKCQTQGSPEPITVWTFGEEYTNLPIGYGRFKMLPGGDLMIVGAEMKDTGKLVLSRKKITKIYID